MERINTPWIKREEVLHEKGKIILAKKDRKYLLF
jgi:hypothetical protein